VANINKHIKESVEGFINAKEPLLRRKDIPIETKQKIKNQILNIENKMNEMNLRMFANNKYRGVPEGLPAIDRETGQLTSFFENVKSMGLNPETFSGKIPSRFKPFAIAAGLTGGLITAAAANTESPQQASELLGQMPQGSPAQINPVDEEGFTNTEKLLAGTTAGGAAYAARRPLLKTAAAIARPFGLPTVAAGFGLSQFVDINPFRFATEEEREAGKSFITRDEKFGSLKEDPSFALAGADLLLPELTKQVGIRSLLANPFGRLARGFTPLGIGLQGIELINQARKEQRRIDAMSPEEREDFIAEQESLLDFSA
jgi:hypothetical protein